MGEKIYQEIWTKMLIQIEGIKNLEVQQFQTTERETTETVAQCLNCEPDRRGGGGCKKDQD